MGRGRGRQFVAKPLEETIHKLGSIFNAPSVMTRRMYRTPIKVGIIVHTLFRGGAEISTLYLCRELKRMGVEVYFLNMPFNVTDADLFLEEDINEIVTKYRMVSVSNQAEKRKAIRDFVEDTNPDVVVTGMVEGVPEILSILLVRPPIIHYSHSDLQVSTGICREKHDAIITVSQQGQRIRKNNPYIKAPIYQIWNGIDPSYVIGGKSLRQELGIRETDFVVGMVGNMNGLKRPMFGLNAFLSSVGQNEDAHIIFVGNYGDQAELLEERRNLLPYPERIHVLGLREDIENIYATLDVMMNCSTSEGLPMSIIEAMFNGIPVIATDVGGNPELIEHGVTGYICRSEDYAHCSNMIKVLYEDRHTIKQMGKNAKMRAQELFTSSRMATNFMGVVTRYMLRPEMLKCSVVMPTYNNEKTIEDAIKSIIAQTEDAFEFVIVNDGSTDKTESIIEQYASKDNRIRLINVPHGGIVGALNKGISSANTKLIVRMDADDIAINDRIEKQLAYLNTHRDVSVLGGQFLSFVDKEIKEISKLPLNHDDIAEGLLIGNKMSHPTTCFYKYVWDHVGGYKGDGRAEDYRFWTEAMGLGFKFNNMPDVILNYRLSHPNSDYHEWVQSIVPQIQQNYKEKYYATRFVEGQENSGE